MHLVEQHIDQVKALCDLHKVETLFVFGSVLGNQFTDSSDIDFVVGFKNVDLYDYADNYLAFKAGLEDIFNRSVDLLEESAVKNPILRKSIDASKVLVYG